MMHVLGLLAIVLASLSLAPPVCAQETIDQARYADAQLVARMKGITVAEALRRYRLQDDVDVLTASIRKIPGYNATIIDSGAKHYHVIVMASPAAVPRIAASPLLRGTALGAVTRIETSRVDRKVLEDVRDELIAALHAMKGPWATKIDHRAGQVVIETPYPIELARIAAVRRFGALVQVRKETRFPRTLAVAPTH